MKTSESITKITPVIIAAQAEMKEVKKNAENPFTKSEYADLEAVLKVVRPILAKYKLSVLQFPGFVDGRPILTYRLLHESGEWFEDDCSVGTLPPDPQKVGSVYTYLRRYSLMAVCGIAPEDDDASQSEFSKKKKKAQEPMRARNEQDIYSLLKALPTKTKDFFKQAKIYEPFEQHKLYRAVAGDLDALNQLLEEKARKIQH